MNKLIVGIGLVFWIVGVAVLAFPVPEEYVETVQIDEWNLQSLTLAPPGEDRNSTFYGRYMGPGTAFIFDVASSGSVELRVSVVRQNPESITPIYTQIGTYFNRTMVGFQGGTYLVEIENKSPQSVTLQGNVQVTQSETKQRNVYPYAIPGALVIAGSTGVSIYGVFKNPSKSRRSRAKRAS